MQFKMESLRKWVKFFDNFKILVSLLNVDLGRIDGLLADDTLFLNGMTPNLILLKNSLLERQILEVINPLSPGFLLGAICNCLATNQL